MDRIGRLEAIEEIKQVKARYFRGLDLKDRPLLRSVFTDDATADFRNATIDKRSGLDAAPVPLGEVVRSGDAITDMIILSGERMDSVHHGSIPEIEILSDTTAKAIWPMVDRLLFKPGMNASALDGWGHYYDTYRCENGKWKIESTRLVRLRVDNTPA